jgi:hypothetical protein
MMHFATLVHVVHSYLSSTSLATTVSAHGDGLTPTLGDRTSGIYTCALYAGSFICGGNNDWALAANLCSNSTCAGTPNCSCWTLKIYRCLAQALIKANGCYMLGSSLNTNNCLLSWISPGLGYILSVVPK